MPALTVREAALACLVLLVLIWDVAVGGRTAQLQSVPPRFRVMTGLCGFLVAPALLAWIGGASALAGRALAGLTWLWPIVTLLFAVQAIHALLRRMVPLAIGGPLAAMNITVAFIASVQYAASLGLDLPAALLAPGVSQANLLATALGPYALTSPFAVVPPVLSPASLARSLPARAARAIVAAAALAFAATLAVGWPPAHRALTAYQRLDGGRPDAAPAPRVFAVGLQILPTLVRLPAPSALHDDLALVDSLRVTAIAVRLAPEGCSAAVLDSLERALEPYRRDSVRLIVTLAYPPAGAHEWHTSTAHYMQQRAGEVDRIVRHLKPDYLVPADDPLGAGAWNLGDIPHAWWRDYFTAMAEVAHRVRPATRVMLATSGFGAADSALYVWASAGTVIDAFAFEIAPGGGGTAVATSLRAADRWMTMPAGSHTTWIVASGAPGTEGDDAQRRVVRHVLAWAAARPSVNGVVLADAADYDRITGFRRPDGRLRGATADAAAMIRLLAPFPSPGSP